MQSGRLKYLHLRYLDIFVDESKAIAIIGFQECNPRKRGGEARRRLRQHRRGSSSQLFYTAFSPFLFRLSLCQTKFIAERESFKVRGRRRSRRRARDSSRRERLQKEEVNLRSPLIRMLNPAVLLYIPLPRLYSPRSG